MPSPTCDNSRVCHKEEAISGDFANAASVERICAFSLRGTGQPSRPNRDAMGSHAWLSHIVRRAISSWKHGNCIWLKSSKSFLTFQWTVDQFWFFCCKSPCTFLKNVCDIFRDKIPEWYLTDFLILLLDFNKKTDNTCSIKSDQTFDKY